jgi:hypothetical protein
VYEVNAKDLKTAKSYLKKGFVDKQIDLRKEPRPKGKIHIVGNYLKDIDADGIQNKKDCDPLDPTRQDKPLPKSMMAKKINVFLNKVAKDYGVEKSFVVDTETEKKNFIEVRTDGFFYENVYDPSYSEIPYLMKEASEEFGFKPPKIDPYRIQNKFVAMLRKNGWNFELYGEGIITIYKEGE